jgi:hypothetical protein
MWKSEIKGNGQGDRSPKLIANSKNDLQSKKNPAEQRPGFSVK